MKGLSHAECLGKQVPKQIPAALILAFVGCDARPQIHGPAHTTMMSLPLRPGS